MTVKTQLPQFTPAHEPAQTVGVALYGCGTVGSALCELLARNNGPLALRYVVVRDITRLRALEARGAEITSDRLAPHLDARVNVVIELIGGTDAAAEVVFGALAAGKHVVTANKALLARYGAQLEELAARNGVLLRYEAAVGGAIPILRTLRTALPGNRIRRLRGIVNGTTNYILTRMSEEGLPFSRALAKAQSLGYAEADPAADVTGIDAAQKLVILARHAFGHWLPVSSVAVRGIEGVSLRELQQAQAQGCVIKLVAEAVENDRTLSLTVAPQTLPASHPLAGVRNELNAIEVETDFAGPLLLQGSGAGGRATASAVYSDVVDAATYKTRRPDS